MSREDISKAATALAWYADMELNDVVAAEPSDMATWIAKRAPNRAPQRQPSARSASKQAKATTTAQIAPTAKISGMAAPMPTDEAIAQAISHAANAENIEQLRAAIMDFDGCPLKPGARNTVIDDGIVGASLMILGEAPGKDEDKIGRPFVGRAGQLLDKMLFAIGHSRSEDELAPAYISNSIFWRPPGNRAPTKTEIAICLPFVQRLIELAAPKILILVGNTPTQTLFEGTPGITRARGRWLEYRTPSGKMVPALPMFHPAFLLRQPAQKRLAWADLLAVKERLTASE